MIWRFYVQLALLCPLAAAFNTIGTKRVNVAARRDRIARASDVIGLDVHVDERDAVLGQRAQHSTIPPVHADDGQSLGWTFYHVAILPLLALLLVLLSFSHPKLDVALPAGFRSFQASYLSVWVVAVAADWLQGPYVYALYASYGYSQHDISLLFVTGFAASMIFGTFVGSLADTWGRKKSALLYCLLYTFSCLTKHFSGFWYLILGRITGGIATSLLFSIFECWMITEHRKRHEFSEPLLRYMFSLMFLAQYATAIVTGFVSQAAATAHPLTPVAPGSIIHYGGNIVPFDLAIVCLIAGAVMIAVRWDENYGEVTEHESPMQRLRLAVSTVRSSWPVSLLGVVVACFEGSMYAFILNWTPALRTGTASTPPYGVVFSGFMMAAMAGSALFGILHPERSPAQILATVMLVSGMAIGAVAVFVGTAEWTWMTFAMFLVFEFCVGLYFPAVGALKSAVVPERARAGVYNVYRVPLNLVVVLLSITNMSLKVSFGTSALLLCIAFGAVFLLGDHQEISAAKRTVEA